jgi:predicted DNA-binding ribbon-helix-helix protein
MKSLVVKRGITINGYETSITLEDAFWISLKEIAHSRRATLSKLLAEIDETRQGNLSSAIRVFVLEQVRRNAAKLVEDRVSGRAAR